MEEHSRERTKTIIENANVRVNEKFRIQERILDYNSNEETNLRPNRENVVQELFYESDIDLQTEN